MREIKFRGKGIESGEWFYGQFVDDYDSGSAYGYIVNGVIESNEEYIAIEEWFPVKKETVGQFTGLLDKNGKEIYEGDLIMANTPYSTEEAKQVFWDKERAGFFLKCRYAAYDRKNLYKMSAFKMEIIGNIYENPELLEVEK